MFKVNVEKFKFPRELGYQNYPRASKLKSILIAREGSIFERKNKTIITVKIS